MNESTRNFLIFLFFIYILSTPTSNEERYPSYINREHILDKYHNEVNVSRTALFDNDFSSGYGNITGFELSYEDSINNLNASNWPFHNTFYEDQKYSILPNEISIKASEIWNLEGKTVDNFNNSKIGSKLNDGAFPLNISGSLKGDFHLNEDLRLHKFKFYLPKYLNKLYEYRESQRLERTNPRESEDTDDIIPTPIGDEPNQRAGNITDSIGLVQLSFLNEPNSYVNETNLVSVDLKLSDLSQKNDHRLNLRGVYHQDSGNLIVSTQSSKFQSAYALPHLNLGLNDYFNKTRHLLTKELNESKIEDINFSSLESSVDASDQCEYIGYFHFESTNLTKSQWTDIDNELSFPLGRPLQKIPKLKINKGLLYSPDCGTLIDMNELIGSRNEIFYDSLKTFLLFSIGLMICQLLLIVRQISLSNTPSSLSKLSFATVMIMNTFDSSICIISLICSMIYSDLYIQFAMLSFISFTCCALYEMKYAIQIYCVQINERPLDWRTMLQGTPIDERISANNDNQQQTDPLVPIDNNEQTVGAELYSRNFFFLLILIFLSLNVITWPKTPRKIFEYIISFILNSYWVPQIYRNTLRGSRTSFSWEFILLTSVIRLIPFVYIEGFSNPFDHHRDIPLVVILISWMAFQIIVLYLQEEYGPRFFLNDKFLPKTYDYYPEITKSDLKSFHIDESVISDTNVWVTDCAICMQKVDIPISEDTQIESPDLELGNSGQSSIKSHRISKRKNYMVTPCNHVFHTDCLENWMMYKLQCPNCRSSIPPY